MTEKLNYEIERAKLRANYWNGLAIATMALGALPFLIGLTGGEVSPTGEFDWLKYGVAASAAFFASGLSRLFHVIGLRAISKVCAGF